MLLPSSAKFVLQQVYSTLIKSIEFQIWYICTFYINEDIYGTATVYDTALSKEGRKTLNLFPIKKEKDFEKS